MAAQGESPSLPPSPPSPAPPAEVAEVTHSLTMNTGWTWISSPLFNSDIYSPRKKLNDIVGNLGGLATDQTDMIKNQLAFSNYIPGFGWFGQLEYFSPRECYKVRLVTGGGMSFTGIPASNSGSEIILNDGWTWIGWPKMTAGPVSAFIDAMSDPSKLSSQDDRIKSQYLFTSYIPGFGWFGDLTTFEPGLGYMVKLSQGCPSTGCSPLLKLVGFGSDTPGTRRKLDSKRELEVTRVETQPVRTVGSGAWQLTPASFEFSMCVVAVVVVDGTVAEDGDLAAFVNGQLRGIAKPSSYRAPVGSYKGYKSYNLMAYGEMDTVGAAVTFQYRYADGRVSALKPTMAFAKDGFLGTVIEPFVISHSSAEAGSPATPAAAAAAIPTPTPTPTPTPSATPVAVEASPHQATEAAVVTEVPEDTKTTLNIGIVAAITVGSLLIVLVVVVLCVRLANSRSSASGKAMAVAEVVVPQKVDIDASPVSAA